MSVTYIPTQNNTGNILGAIGAWDQFFGPTSKQNAQQLANSKIAGQGAQQAIDFAAENHGPELDALKSAAKLHANEVENSNLDLGTRKGTLAAYPLLPPELQGMPTTEMSPDQLNQWTQAQSDQGVTDFGGAAMAHNKTVSATRGKFATPKGGLPTGYTTDSGGNTSLTGAVLPDLSKLGFTPSAPGSASAPAPGGASSPALGPVTAPAIPDLTFEESLNPFLRQFHEYQIENAQKQQGLQKGAQEITAGARAQQMGTPEEQAKASDFSDNAAGVFKDLNELRQTVHDFGNVEMGVLGNPAASEKLDSLPKHIAESWRHIQNPGGAPLKPGAVTEAAEHIIPMPKPGLLNLGGYLSTDSNAKTTAGIDAMQEKVIEKIRAYENNPATRLPVLGLDPAIREKIGPTRLVPQEVKKPQAPTAPMSASSKTNSFVGPDGFTYVKAGARQR